MRKLRLVMALLLVSGCGGGGGSSPSGPSNAAPVPGIVFLGGTPSPGSTITVTSCGGTCTSTLTTTYRVTSSQGLLTAALYVEYFNAAQIRCGFDFTDTQSLTANQATTFSSHFLVLGDVANQPPYCAYPATTSRIHVSLLGPNGVNGQRFMEADFAQPYTFTGPEIAGGPGPSPTQAPGPAPTPRPTATPKPEPTPPPASAGSCNGATAPNSCEVGSGQPPASARCNDGKWSCSANRQGTCSRNGGVACWVCPGPLC